MATRLAFRSQRDPGVATLCSCNPVASFAPVSLQRQRPPLCWRGRGQHPDELQNDFPVTLTFTSDDNRPAAVQFQLEVDGFRLDLVLPDAESLACDRLPPDVLGAVKLAYIRALIRLPTDFLMTSTSSNASGSSSSFCRHYSRTPRGMIGLLLKRSPTCSTTTESKRCFESL